MSLKDYLNSDPIDRANERIEELEQQVSDIECERDVAIMHIAKWCVAIEEKGSSWDEWDEFYKDAMYRDSALPEIRELLNDAIASVKGGDDE